MTLAGAWLLVPLVFTGLCTGIGLLAEAATRRRVPGPFLPAVGLAGLVVIAGLLTVNAWSAKLAAPACALAAVAGLVVGRPWTDPRLGRTAAWALAGVAVVALVAAAPSLLSGQGEVLGYIKLDDTVIWLALIERFMDHGRDLSAVAGHANYLPPSTYRRTLENWLGQAYPIGSMTPIGVTARLTGQAYVNAFQPVMTGYVAVLGLGLFGVARELVESPRRAALAAVIGTQASTFFGYVAWGGIKEVSLAALLPAAASVRELPLLGLLGAAILCVFGVGGVVFAGPALLAGLVIVAVRREWRPIPFVAGLVVLVAGTLPVISVLSENANQMINGAPSNDDATGKLIAPLETLQGAGLWPEGDFRYPVAHHGLVVALAVLGLLLAAGAVAAALSQRRSMLPVLLGSVVAGGAVAAYRGVPWIDAKVFAITSPMLLTASAAALLWKRWSQPFVLVLVVGAAISSLLINRDVYVAPRDSLAEQRDLGDALAKAKDRRTVMLNYEGYSTRYLLGPANVQGITELRYDLIPNLQGQSFPNYTTAEMDDVQTAALLTFNAIVRRTTPVGSLPPSPYAPFRAGRYFESWTRDASLPAPLSHLPLQTGILPAAPVDCTQLRALAQTAGAETIAAAPRENPVLADITSGQVPGGWVGGPTVQPATDGTARVPVDVPTAGRWRVWIGGQSLGHLSVSVDGKPVGSYRHELDAAAGWMRFATLDLSAGRHVVALAYERGPFWRAGRGAKTAQAPLGPVALSPTTTETVQRVPAGDYQTLCDSRTYDWFEALP